MENFEISSKFQFSHLLGETQDEKDYEDPMDHANDLIGRLAKRVYHIKKVGDKYYHFLDLDEE